MLTPVEEILAEYGLPELPEPADDIDGETAKLVLARFKQENIWLGDGFTIPDAIAYCSRDDTSGNDWFVCWYRQ